jgi:hypothetical protein
MITRNLRHRGHTSIKPEDPPVKRPRTRHRWFSHRKPIFTFRMNLVSVVCHAILILVVSFAHAQPNQRLVENYPIEARDLVPDLGPDLATELIDRLCSQDPYIPERWPVEVKGAFNNITKQFLTWPEYLAGPGENAPNLYLRAVYPWATFRGSCDLTLFSTWVTNTAPSVGPSLDNIHLEPTAYRLDIDVPLPGFSCTTTQDSWEETVQEWDIMTWIVTGLQLPANVIQTWDWVRKRQHIERVSAVQYIPECTTAWLTATMAMRTVRLREVFVVWEYCNYDEQGRPNRDDTWDGRGDQNGWRQVYSSGARIDCTALTLQLPPPHQLWTNLQMQTLNIPRERCISRRSMQS